MCPTTLNSQQHPNAMSANLLSGFLAPYRFEAKLPYLTISPPVIQPACGPRRTHPARSEIRVRRLKPDTEVIPILNALIEVMQSKPTLGKFV